MSNNVFIVPEELYVGDLPDGFALNLYIGRMVGQLQTMRDNPRVPELVFEIPADDDPTEYVLRYHTFSLPAEQLARWMNYGDTVGIVIAHKGSRIEMLLAANFTRGKLFWTDYYPHRKDTSTASKRSLIDTHNRVLMCCNTLLAGGLLLMPFALYANIRKYKQYQRLNPPGFRRVTAARIADWLIRNQHRILSHPIADNARISL